jgi:rRNA small subunit aminocarboxypropyltransferase
MVGQSEWETMRHGDKGRKGLGEEETPMAAASPLRPLSLCPLFPPPTVIVVHPRERRKKCTVRALRQRDGFVFCNFPRMPYELAGYVRLCLGGPLLSEADASCGLLVLDGTWRHVQPMERTFAAIPIRSLPPVITAYPRTSKVSTDPDGGLATIEAIYAAYRLLGRDTAGLLDHYHWAAEFVESNNERWPVAPAP